MLEKEKGAAAVVGNYFELPSCRLNVPEHARETMASFLEELHATKGDY